ncbi:hypothetical protein O7632_10145 [Solwaraspora sp. WMMD406]|uniref:Vgb family protein n=1 Tax=Solwaraspora sp. WMMD406 TaxID=3016095 RepID=UPI0024160C7D|nr:hypothetical protein [Solwaraspora sp. WMMD406]MDG4764461.1 hypothetical protein [Solwaraspora sp. WMMD406]
MHIVTGRWCAAALCVALVTTGCQETPHPTPPPSATTGVIKLPGNAGPTNMALAADGALWIVEHRMGAIAEVDPTGRVTQHRVPGRVVQPGSILAAQDGRTADWRLGWIDRPRGFAALIGEGKSPRSGSIRGLTVGPDGAIWFIAASTTPSVRRAHPTEGIRVMASLPGTANQVPQDGLTTGPDQAVWFTMSDGIGRVGHDGRYTRWPLPPKANPRQIIAGPDDALWFIERRGIGRITISGVVSHTPVPVPDPEWIRALTSGPDGALWFITDTQVGRLQLTGTPELWPVAGAKRLSAIVTAPDGSLWLADSRTNLVLRFRPPQ